MGHRVLNTASPPPPAAAEAETQREKQSPFVEPWGAPWVWTVGPA